MNDYPKELAVDNIIDRIKGLCLRQVELPVIRTGSKLIQLFDESHPLKDSEKRDFNKPFLGQLFGIKVEFYPQLPFNIFLFDGKMYSILEDRIDVYQIPENHIYNYIRPFGV